MEKSIITLYWWRVKMLIDELVNKCDERYTENKDNCQCERCRCESCDNNNCAECLKHIHFPNTSSENRTYDCVNMADYYYCKYSYRYASEVVYGLKQFKDIMHLDKLKVMSVGCGPCTELAAIDYLHHNGVLKYSKLDFRGIDPLGNMWRHIWNDINSYYDEQVSFYEKDILELVDVIVEKNWIPDLIVFQYVFSDMYKKNCIEVINTFINKLAKFLNEKNRKSIYIIANDANLAIQFKGGRDFFDTLERKIQEPKNKVRYHFNNNYKQNHYHYGTEYDCNDILFEIPEHIRNKYEPIKSCASAQVLIKKEEKEEI